VCGVCVYVYALVKIIAGHPLGCGHYTRLTICYQPVGKKLYLHPLTSLVMCRVELKINGDKWKDRQARV